MYQALYRKWRPKTFDDVIGQSHITATLQKQVDEGRTSHAYLFTGTRGTGKTTCAKILAKAVNCEHPENGNPCCKCPSCRGIENGSFLDVLELDAASNNGVDQVRALRDEAIYAPANVKKRVYIIDEVHMLSISAFNALLKILEEPPEHLMFILATTELHKVPATILSRCQRFSFKRIKPTDVAARLNYVAKQEQIDLTPDGAELLSRLADGALRDGLSLLDQCAGAGGTVDAKAVLDVLGLAGNLQTAQLMDCIARRDAKAGVLLLNQLYAGGKDVGAVLGELSTLTRDLLLRKIAPEGGTALLSGGFDSATLDSLDQSLSATRLLYLASALQKTTADLYYSSNRRTDAELCILRLCDEALCGDLSALNARMDRLEEHMAVLPMTIRTQAAAPVSPAPQPKAERAAPTTRPAPQPVQKPAPAVEDAPPWENPPLPEEPPMMDEPPLPEEPPMRENEFAAAMEPPMQEEPPTEPATSGPAIPPQPAAPTAPAAPSDPAVWQQLLEECKGGLPAMYRVFLDKCRGVLEGDLLTVYVPDDITKNRLDNDRVLTTLKEKGEALTGGAMQVRLVVGSGPQTSQADRMKNLLKFGSQFDTVQIK
jgi:DNA polymerase-3 subunit gamma/tau